jgi:hypothetical protein
MHAQYLSNRDSILRVCVEREVDGLLVHAYACLKSQAHCLGRERTNDAITRFLDDYHQWLPSGSSPRADRDSVGPNLVRWMAEFQLEVAKLLGRKYGAWALESCMRRLHRRQNSKNQRPQR